MLTLNMKGYICECNQHAFHHMDCTKPLVAFNLKLKATTRTLYYSYFLSIFIFVLMCQRTY